MKEVELVKKYLYLEKKAQEVGLNLEIQVNDTFGFSDVPGAPGLVLFDSVDDVDTFLDGYTYGYHTYRANAEKLVCGKPPSRSFGKD